MNCDRDAMSVMRKQRGRVTRRMKIAMKATEAARAQNNDGNQEEKDSHKASISNERQNEGRSRKIFDAMKAKGKTDSVEEEGAPRLFSVSWNGLGPRLSGKIEQIKRARSEKRVV